MSALLILAPGPLTTVQDLGRPGRGQLGVARSGAADRSSLVQANRVVGNPDGAAALETTLGGLRLRAVGELRLVVTGPPVPLTVVRAGDRTEATVGQLLSLSPGDELRLGRPAAGLRHYVAVGGGVDLPPVLGSRSTDLMSGLGPSPLAAGQVLRVGPAPGLAVAAATALRIPGLFELLVQVGPREDWFTAEALRLLFSQEWMVTPDSNRVGLRLSGSHPLERSISSELPSEPMVPGALQVPPSGQPVLFLPDHPVTGGYPVIGVVNPAGLDLAGQARPGTRLRFIRG